MSFTPFSPVGDGAFTRWRSRRVSIVWSHTHFKEHPLRSTMFRTIAALAAVSAVTAAPAAAGPANTGPSSSTKPYVVPVAPGVQTRSLITVGDAATNGYRYVGIPDGLGLYTKNGVATVLTNHELRGTQGVVRRHGQKGAFVSQLTINPHTYEVTTGADLIDPGVAYWNYVTQAYSGVPSTGGANPRNLADAFPAQTAEFQRFCSSSLTDPRQLFNPATGRGYNGQIYFANEESGDEGRLFGVTTDGTAVQLPKLSLFSWENTIAAPNRGDRTVVLGNEDGGDGQLWVYAGSKSRKGGPFTRAGLTNGFSSVIDAVDETVTNDAEFRAKYGKGTPAEVDLSEVEWDQSGAAQNKEAKADGLTLNRIEDGAFDPRNPNAYYFLTTEGGDKTVPSGYDDGERDGGGLWKLTFEDVDHPELGGTLELVLDGSEAPYLSKPDNLTIEGRNLLIQEDPGNTQHVARIVAYSLASGKRGVVAEFDRSKFGTSTPTSTDAPITMDEESSGIIPASGPAGPFPGGTFLFDAQVHKASPDPELVEPGQLLALRVLNWSAVYTIG